MILPEGVEETYIIINDGVINEQEVVSRITVLIEGLVCLRNTNLLTLVPEWFSPATIRWQVSR